MPHYEDAEAILHERNARQNRARWEAKPVLREVYGDSYRRIFAHVREDIPGVIVELGSGIANIKAFRPDVITTDVFPGPGIDRVEDAYALGFQDRSVSNLILFDVWHHLEYPGSALDEFRRVLCEGGRIILFEPAVSATGLLVYGLFHREPLGLGRALTWRAPQGTDLGARPYFAAQASASRVFMSPSGQGRMLPGWKLVSAERLASISYVMSGGYSGPALYTLGMLPFMRKVDQLAGRLPGLFATRLLVVLEKIA